jgi:hypothetical protein
MTLAKRADLLAVCARIGRCPLEQFSGHLGVCASIPA